MRQNPHTADLSASLVDTINRLNRECDLLKIRCKKLIENQKSQSRVILELKQELRHAQTQASNKIQALNTFISEQQRTLAEQNSLIDKLLEQAHYANTTSVQLKSKDSMIAALQRTIQEQEETIKNQTNEIFYHTQTIRSSEQAISEMNTTISEQETDINELTLRYEVAMDLADKINKEKKQYQNQLEALNHKLCHKQANQTSTQSTTNRPPNMLTLLFQQAAASHSAHSDRESESKTEQEPTSRIDCDDTTTSPRPRHHTTAVRLLNTRAATSTDMATAKTVINTVDGIISKTP